MSKKLKMSTRALMACGCKCFKCEFEMPSGPAKEIFYRKNVFFYSKGIKIFFTRMFHVAMTRLLHLLRHESRFQVHVKQTKEMH